MANKVRILLIVDNKQRPIFCTFFVYSFTTLSKFEENVFNRNNMLKITGICLCPTEIQKIINPWPLKKKKPLNTQMICIPLKSQKMVWASLEDIENSLHIPLKLLKTIQWVDNCDQLWLGILLEHHTDETILLLSFVSQYFSLMSISIKGVFHTQTILCLAINLHQSAPTLNVNRSENWKIGKYTIWLTK